MDMAEYYCLGEQVEFKDGRFIIGAAHSVLSRQEGSLLSDYSGIKIKIESDPDFYKEDSFMVIVMQLQMVKKSHYIQMHLQIRKV